mmetsp:Transcript_13338/g.33376  ORF Transcript_13338/g.33376 Transcript_13338/m.33376 type:complete len:206 (+) Transcript_13338:2681-3298(+)
MRSVKHPVHAVVALLLGIAELLVQQRAEGVQLRQDPVLVHCVARREHSHRDLDPLRLPRVHGLLIPEHLRHVPPQALQGPAVHPRVREDLGAVGAEQHAGAPAVGVCASGPNLVAVLLHLKIKTPILGPQLPRAPRRDREMRRHRRARTLPGGREPGGSAGRPGAFIAPAVPAPGKGPRDAAGQHRRRRLFKSHKSHIVLLGLHD